MLALLIAAAATGPAFPPLTSSDFQDTVRLVETSMEKGDFGEASKLADLLPKRQLVVSCDLSKVPKEDQAAISAAVDRACRGWGFVRAQRQAQGGDVHLSFDADLAVDPDTDAPANVVTFFSNAPGQPRLKAVIGMKRGKTGRAMTPNDVQNDTQYAIGTYLGLVHHSLTALVMFNGSSTDDLRQISKAEYRSVTRVLSLCDLLRSSIEKKQSVGISGKPSVTLSPNGFEGETTQGEIVDLPVEVENHGTGVAMMDAQGDCGCIVPESAPLVKPNEKGTISLRLETVEYSLPLERKVTVFTNDPDHAVTEIPVKINVHPRYRFINPIGPMVLVDEKAKDFDMYLVFPDGQDMKVGPFTVQGIPGATVTSEAWQGSIADEERKEPAQTRHGFHVRVHLPANLPNGRLTGGVSTMTNSLNFSNLYYNFYVQRGILAAPHDLFLGEVGKTPKTATILLLRPGKPFAIRNVKTSAPFLVASAEPGAKPGEMKVNVNYTGAAASGEISEMLTVETDDPKQPVIKIPVTGSVR